MKPQEPIPHNYAMRSLNWIFLWSSVVLLLVTVLIVGYDYLRGWKWFQLEFLRMHGCDEVQGFLIGHPKALDELLPQLPQNRIGLPAAGLSPGVLEVSIR